MTFDAVPLQDRSAMYRAIRGYFDGRGYLEVDTPVLTRCPIPESHIELFRTESRGPEGRDGEFHLVPSPEVWMKLLLAGGAPSLYQISPCFRNGEQTDRWHRPEFRMLEWYAAGASAEDNINVMQDILTVCAAAVNPEASECVTGRIERRTMEEAFLEFAGFSLEEDLRSAGLAELRPGDAGFEAALREAGAALASRLRERNLPEGGGASEESADDLFHRLFLTLVEDRLPAERPLALTDWPALVPTLARRVPGTPWAERWELYVRGIEVANCYGEENEEKALEAYWKAESERKALAGDPLEAASDWPKRIAEGMPYCSGSAVGLDRLLALIRGETSLEGVDLFPINGMMRR